MKGLIILGESAVVHLARVGRSGGGDNAWMGDDSRTVVKAVGNLAVAGVMCRGIDRSKKPRLLEGPCPDDGRQSLCLTGVTTRCGGDAGHGKGGT
ncbi:MAG: hypothetical protein GF309_16810 [Candidatus Lokiarchaeota archaeon]|nr:hypothetical protein [Candidatus Lokiarchaeota archaeon]